MSTLASAAALVGGHCWAERHLFELLGRWSATASDPAAVVLLDRHSQHAAWRAAQWWDRLPLLAGVDRTSLVAPGPAWAAWAAAAPSDPGADRAGGVASLGVAYRVLLPRLAADYARHQTVTSPASDGPVRRTLGHVRADLIDDWVEGELLLHGLLTGPAVDGVAAAVAAAETLFVA